MSYIHVKIKTSSKKESILRKNDDHFEVCVKEKAERNMVNKRLLEIISSYFDLNINKVRIVNGHHSTSKLLILED